MVSNGHRQSQSQASLNILDFRILQDSSTSSRCACPAKSESMHLFNGQAVYVRATNADPATTLLANTCMHLTEFVISCGLGQNSSGLAFHV